MGTSRNTNEERFSDRAIAYERYRTRFPHSIIERLRDAHGLTSSDVVADVGAGTGMLAELFLRNGNEVVAIEPNAAMRAGCDRLQEEFPRLTVVAANAEATTLANASVDFVAVGRAFHWFDRARAIAEFARILRPGGRLVLVASRWAGDGSAPACEFEEILKTRALDYQKVLDAQLGEEDIERLFDAGDLLLEDLHGEQWLTLEELLGRAESLSVTPLPGHPKYDSLRAALEQYFSAHQQDGRTRMSVSYRLLCGRIAQ